jgi:hypothetical protein
VLASRAARPIPFARAPSFDHGASFVEVNQPIRMSFFDHGDFAGRIPAGPKMFLRLMPDQAVDRVAEADLLKSVVESELWPLGYERYSGSSIGRCRYGVCRICRHPKDETLIGAIVLVMPSREIWGIETHLLTPAGRQTSQEAYSQIIPTALVQRIFTGSLKSYLRFAQSKLDLNPPFVIVAGISDVEGYRLALPQNQLSDTIFSSSIVQEISINDPETGPEKVLHPFFSSIYDAVGIRMTSGS